MLLGTIRRVEAPSPPKEDREPVLREIREGLGIIGRDPQTIEITSGRAVPSPDSVKQLEDLGVSRFMVPPPAFDPDGITAGLEKLGGLIAKL